MSFLLKLFDYHHRNVVSGGLQIEVNTIVDNCDSILSIYLCTMLHFLFKIK